MQGVNDQVKIHDLMQAFRDIREEGLKAGIGHYQIRHLKEGFVAAKFVVRFEVAAGYQVGQPLT